jgi:hypothetical protein
MIGKKHSARAAGDDFIVQGNVLVPVQWQMREQLHQTCGDALFIRALLRHASTTALAMRTGDVSMGFATVHLGFGVSTVALAGQGSPASELTRAEDRGQECLYTHCRQPFGGAAIGGGCRRT